MAYVALGVDGDGSAGSRDAGLHVGEGLVRGVSLDGVVNAEEIGEIRAWVERQGGLVNRHPFNELIPRMAKALEDGRIDAEESEDILWLVRNLTTPSQYYEIITSDVQRLHGLLHGILADGVVNDDEVKGLEEWLLDNEQLKGTYPFDELCSLVATVTSDGTIDADERAALKSFLAEFVDVKSIRGVDLGGRAAVKDSFTIQGICAIDPAIAFDNRCFCLTGLFAHGERIEISGAIRSRGAVCKEIITRDTDYLVVGSQGNPCWAFSCYGRKVEKAVEMRKQGSPISIVSEVDLWDAMQ